MSNNGACLIVGAGALQVPLIREAQALGLYTIATDANPDAPGAAVCDEFYHYSTYDVQGHRTLAHQLQDRHSYTMRGCCTAGADVAPTVAAVCEVWETPGIPFLVAKRTYNKADVRFALSQAALGIYQPEYATLYAHEWRETPNISQFCAESAYWHLRYPVVIKPITQRASRGVSIIQDVSLIHDAIQKAFGYSDPILIEQCLVGTEHSAEMILDGSGNIFWFNVVDRIFNYSSGTPIELGHINPTCLIPEQVMDIALMMGYVAKALDVLWGPFKADVMMTADGPKILEVTARLSGGWDCQKTSPLTGRHPMRTLLQLACGMEVERQPTILETDCVAACAAILPQKTGVVHGYPAWNYLTPTTKALIDDVVWSVRPGDTIAPASHNGERAGFVFTAGPTSDAAWQRALRAAEALADGVDVA